MLRPEQIANAKFTPVSTGTYSAEEVDAFLSIVAEAYQESLNEKADLLKKMSILANKVDSYRKDEDAIKAALLDAHKMAENLNRTAAEKAKNTVDKADADAAEIRAKAESEAAELSAEARTQASELVSNARTAVESIKNRARSEADETVANAKSMSERIIGDANTQALAIVGTSKKDYEYYSRELDRVKSELENFRAMVEMLCNGEMIPEAEIPAAPVVEAPVVEEAPAAPVIDIPAPVIEAPVIEAPAVEAEPEDSFASASEDDDFLAMLDEETSELESLASDLDAVVPEKTATVDSIIPPVDIPAPSVEDVPQYEAEDDEDGDADDFFAQFSDDSDDGLDIPGGSSDDDEDITSLFDSLFD